MKQKRNIAIVMTVVLVASLCMLSLTACSRTLSASNPEDLEQIRAEWAKVPQYLENSRAESNYRIRTQYIIGSSTIQNNEVSQVQYLIEYRVDDPETAANEYGMRIERSETSLTSTTYEKAFYGAMLSVNDDVKKSSADQYKIYQVARNGKINVTYTDPKTGKTTDSEQAVMLRTETDEETFFRTQLDDLRTNADTKANGTSRTDKDTVGLTRNQYMDFVQAVVDSDLLPTTVTMSGKVTTFYFELDEAHKHLALNNGAKQLTRKDGSVYYPLYLRFTQERLDKITDHNDTPTMRLYITYYPSNFTLPRYDADWTQYYDADGNLQTVLPANYTIKA